ncbi:hypothetical protein FPHOBKDP_00061 [Listeria phage LPJP1]|nr:hypothetical protein FPHOBKDP_00061 [Listeria phage LPJP1]
MVLDDLDFEVLINNSFNLKFCVHSDNKIYFKSIKRKRQKYFSTITNYYNTEILKRKKVSSGYTSWIMYGREQPIDYEKLEDLTLKITKIDKNELYSACIKEIKRITDVIVKSRINYIIDNNSLDKESLHLDNIIDL